MAGAALEQVVDAVESQEKVLQWQVPGEEVEEEEEGVVEGVMVRSRVAVFRAGK